MDKLLEDLKQFTGSEIFYRHPMNKKYVHTEGVRYLAQKAQCYWLLEDIFIHQSERILNEERFQVWCIKVADDHSATINITDGNDNLLKSIGLKLTDFPLQEFTLWFIDGTLLLPSEY